MAELEFEMVDPMNASGISPAKLMSVQKMACGMMDGLYDEDLGRRGVAEMAKINVYICEQIENYIMKGNYEPWEAISEVIQTTLNVYPLRGTE